MSFDSLAAQTAYYIAFNLTKALTAIIQRDSFLYWPFLASAVVIALAVAVASRAAGSFRAAVRKGFSRNVWWHPSARADYRLYLANALVLPVLFAVLLFSEKRVVHWLDALTGGASSTAAAADASIVSRIAFTIVFFLAYDLGRF